MTTILSVELEDTTAAALDRLAEEFRSPRERLAARAVENLVTHEAWLFERIESGLAAAEAGAFASQDEVERVRFTRAG